MASNTGGPNVPGFCLQFSLIRLPSSSSQMTMYDCFELGRQSYLNEDYYYAEQWMNEALARLDDNTDQFQNITEDDILEYYTLSLVKQGQSHLNDRQCIESREKCVAKSEIVL